MTDLCSTEKDIFLYMVVLFREINLLSTVSSNFPLTKKKKNILLVMHKKFFRKQKHGKIHVVRDYMDNPLFAHVEVKTGKASSGLWVWISYCCLGSICKAAGGCLNDMAQFFLAQLLAALKGCNRPACFWYKGQTKRQTWGDTGEWYVEIITFLDYSKKNLDVCNPPRFIILWETRNV